MKSPLPEELGKSKSDAITPGEAKTTKAQPHQVLPRYRRTPEIAPAFILTPRDIAILEDVWRFGLLTTGQIETLRAGDETPALRFVSRLTLTRRLKLLFHHRYLRRLPRPLAQGSQEPVYVLDHGGARTLSLHHGEVSARPPSRLPKAVALDHLLEVAQVRVALSTAPKTAGMQLVEWLPGEKVRFRTSVEAPGERRQNISLVPDAGIILRVQPRDSQSLGSAHRATSHPVPLHQPTHHSPTYHRHTAFLEVDRGTEALRVLAAKCRAYLAYWQSSGFAHDFGVPRGLGFWVLLVAPTPKREATILRAIAGIEGPKVMFRVALASEIRPRLIGERVWQEGDSGQKVCFWELPRLE